MPLAVLSADHPWGPLVPGYIASGLLAPDTPTNVGYVTDRAHADAAGRAHGEIFGTVRPAATMIIVAGLLHPDMLVEVDVEAYLPAAT